MRRDFPIRRHIPGEKKVDLLKMAKEEEVVVIKIDVLSREEEECGEEQELHCFTLQVKEELEETRRAMQLLDEETKILFRTSKKTRMEGLQSI